MRRQNYFSTCLSALVAVLFLTVASDVAQGAESERVVVRAGTLYTLDDVHAGPLENAWVLIENGKVLEVSASPELPDGIPVVDYSRETIIPGLVATGISPTGGAVPEKSVAPEFHAVDSYDFFDENDALLAGGVTTLGVTTGSSWLLSGRGLVVKTAGSSERAHDRIVRPVAGFHVTLGDASKNPPPVYDPPIPPTPDNPFEVLKRQAPVSRGGALRALGQVLDRGRAYLDQLEKSRRGEGPAPEPDAELEPLLEILDGRDSLIVHADRVQDLLAMLEFAEAQNIKILFDGASEAHRIVSLLRERSVPLIVRGEFVPGRIPSGGFVPRAQADRRVEGFAASLIQSGLSVAIRSSRTRTAGHLLLQAVESSRHGLDVTQALHAVTRTPAELLGVGHHVGSIAAGKDADLVVLSADPFVGNSQTVAVYIDGEICYPRSTPTKKDDLQGAVAIRCGSVHTASKRGVIPGGVMVVDKDGKIVRNGTAALLEKLPAHVRVIDASDETVVPGRIDAGSHVGLRRDSVDLNDRAAPEAGGGRATYRSAEAVDLTDAQLDAVRRAGITTVLLSPDPRGAFAGQ